MSEWYKGEDIVLFHIKCKTLVDDNKHFYLEVFQGFTHRNNVLTSVIIPIKFAQFELP